LIEETQTALENAPVAQKKVVCPAFSPRQPPTQGQIAADGEQQKQKSAAVEQA
jgi:hypothetical protein